MKNVNILDGFNFLSKLTIRRLINAFKIWFSFVFSSVLQKNIQWGLPISISIEPTTSCNLRCPECPSGLRSFSRDTGMLQKALFEKAIQELSPFAIYLTLYFQGEPYLNPDFFNYVKLASKKKLYTATSTNAHFLDDENARQTVLSGLDRLIISIDGTSQESYEKYRVGGTLEKVITGTKNIVKWKKKLGSNTPHLMLQMVVLSTNENHIPELYDLAEELGVNEVRLKTAQLYDFENGNSLMPSQSKYSRYIKKKDGRYALKNEVKNRCWRLWSGAVITWDGNVVPCCFDKDAKHKMGSITIDEFKYIWTNPQYNGFRKSLVNARNQIDICRNCTEGSSVWLKE